MEFIIGIILIVTGGLLEGVFPLGLKMTPSWKWEHTWGLGSLFALLIMSWPIAFLTIPGLLEVYSKVPFNSLIVAALFGLGWGIGGIFYGLAVDTVGIALGVSLLMGITSIFGSAGPSLILEPEIFTETSGLALIIGLIVMITGVIVCAFSGKRKEADLIKKVNSSPTSTISTKQKTFLLGLIFCILGGFLSPLVNYAFIFGDDIRNAAKSSGATSASSVYAIWAVVFTTNYLVNFMYSIFLIIKNRNFEQFVKQSTVTNWLWALFLGITWPLGIVLYGMGADKLGRFGAYAGFPMMLTCSLLGSNITGVLIGEWKGVGRSTKLIMKIGVLILILAAILFGYANSIMTKE
jgi:L-rhamnose-H+ transport protein